ncbi:hypothetical protein RJ640_020569 [Escallonia rubra]|uniref:Ty3 transposon capsid-like protein domain-containing protein n=1 Tax=Escallonia rubra TaxID=112253 RepID=A0AA88QJB3_9ASTE|nr:hypothetical protein RJ640_020569 [Escallonia rubra]
MPRSVRGTQTAEAELQEFQGTMDTKLAANDIRMDSMEATIGDLQREQTAMLQGFTELKLELASFMTQINAKLGSPPRINLEKGESSHKNHRIEYTNTHNFPPPECPTENHNLPKFPKLTFPRFEGINPRGWVRKCEQYFEFCPIHEDYKVSYASVHFDAQAECWYAAYIKPLGRVRWGQFVKDLYARFSLSNGISVMGDFNRLVQVGSVDEYFNNFEVMRAQVVQEFDYLDEDYFCMSFIGGLKPEIRSRVEQFGVDTLSKAIYIARREEVAIQNLFRTPKTLQPTLLSTNQSQSFTKINSTPQGPGTTTFHSKNPLLKTTPLQALPFKPNPVPNYNTPQRGLLPTPPKPPPRTNQLTTEEHQRRMAQGLCFKCGAKFDNGHRNSDFVTSGIKSFQRINMSNNTTMKYACEQFDGKTNFGIWQSTVKDILVQQGLLKPLLGNKPESMDKAIGRNYRLRLYLRYG